MKKWLTFLFLLIYSVSQSQTEQDYELFKIINEERFYSGLNKYQLYDNYTDFEYFANYSLRLKDSSDKEIKKSVNYINDFIGVYYPNASRVYYAAVCSFEQPTPQSLINTLIVSSNFPQDLSTYVLPKMILYRVGGKWVGFIYILTFDI